MTINRNYIHVNDIDTTTTLLLNSPQLFGRNATQNGTELGETENKLDDVVAAVVVVVVMMISLTTFIEVRTFHLSSDYINKLASTKLPKNDTKLLTNHN